MGDSEDQKIKTGIYCITNNINQKKYIGQSVNIYRRWGQHKSDCFNSVSHNYHLYRAIRKYGLNNFSFEILEICEKEELDEKEIYYINLYDTYNNGYNSTLGGDKGGNFGKLSPQILNNIIKDLSSSTLTQNQIADKYGLHYTFISDINTGKYHNNSNIIYPIRDNRVCHKCVLCGEEIYSQSIYCRKCYNKTRRKVQWPSREELKKQIRIYPFVKIAEIYNVSDKAITKWCKYYGLPFRKKEIKSYSDEEWDFEI